MKLDLQRLTATGAIALGYAAQALAQSPNKPMNIVYIMSDDHSYQTISAYDHHFIETPNIDWIAQHGTRFTNSFMATRCLRAKTQHALSTRAILPHTKDGNVQQQDNQLQG